MKKNKKVIISIICAVLLIVISLLLVLFVFNNKNSNNENSSENDNIEGKEKITPLMYKVTKEGSTNVMYLFGSVHAADVYNYEFPDYFNKAYEESDYVTCEYDSTKESDLSYYISYYIYQDGTTIKDHISEKSYNIIEKFLDKKGYNLNMYEQFKMSVIFSLIENIVIQDAGVSSYGGIDDFMIHKAQKDGKEVLEVESEVFQMKLLANVPDRVYEIIIVEGIDNYEDEIEEMKNTVEAWKKGDPEKLDSTENDMTDEDISKYSEEDINLILDFYNKLLFDRNITMTERFEQFFNENKKTLFMVGAGHLVGEKGIASLLQEKGYIVEQLNK